MAIAKGIETRDSFKKFWEIGNVNILAVNPTKAELAKLGRDVNEEPIYVTEEDGVKRVKVSFYVRSLEQPNELLNLDFYIRNRRWESPAKGTFQVIDSFGRTAWVNEEQLKNHEIPVYSNGPANIATNYRPTYRGESELTQFVKVYLGIPDIVIWDKDNAKWVPNSKVASADICEIRFDHIDRWFNGDFKEIKEAIMNQPNNTIQVMFGVRTNDQNKQYQSFFNDKFYKGMKVIDPKKYQSEGFKKALADVNSNPATSGKYATTEFGNFGPLKEYSPTATNFEAEAETTSDNPWD